MNELISKSEKLISTRELAEQLGTSPKVVLENAKKCLPNKRIENGKATYWTESEVTQILERMKSSNSNQYTFTGAVKAISTELTPALKLKKALELAQEAYEEELAILRLKNEEQEKKLKISENKNNLLMHSEKTYTMSEISKELGYKSAIEFNKVLYNDKIIFKRNGTWIPYSDYSESGYFEIKQSILENELVVYNLRVTQKGREFLLSKYSDKLF